MLLEKEIFSANGLMQHTLGNHVVPTSKFQVFLKIIWDGPSQLINTLQ
jgi:hypothetical protein